MLQYLIFMRDFVLPYVQHVLYLLLQFLLLRMKIKLPITIVQLSEFLNFLRHTPLTIATKTSHPFSSSAGKIVL